MRLKREALLRKKRNRNFMTTEGSQEDEGTAATTYRATRGQEVKAVNVAKLPKLIKDGFDIHVSEEYTRVNKA